MKKTQSIPAVVQLTRLLLLSPMTIFMAAIWCVLWGMKLAFTDSYQPILFGSPLAKGFALTGVGFALIGTLLWVGNSTAGR